LLADDDCHFAKTSTAGIYWGSLVVFPAPHPAFSATTRRRDRAHFSAVRPRYRRAAGGISSEHSRSCAEASGVANLPSPRKSGVNQNKKKKKLVIRRWIPPATIAIYYDRHRQIWSRPLNCTVGHRQTFSASARVRAIRFPPPPVFARREKSF